MHTNRTQPVRQSPRLPFTDAPERGTYEATIIRHNSRLAPLLALTDPEGQR